MSFHITLFETASNAFTNEVETYSVWEGSWSDFLEAYEGLEMKRETDEPYVYKRELVFDAGHTRIEISGYSMLDITPEVLRFLNEQTTLKVRVTIQTDTDEVPEQLGTFKVTSWRDFPEFGERDQAFTIMPATPSYTYTDGDGKRRSLSNTVLQLLNISLVERGAQ